MPSSYKEIKEAIEKAIAAMRTVEWNFPDGLEDRLRGSMFNSYFSLMDSKDHVQWCLMWPTTPKPQTEIEKNTELEKFREWRDKLVEVVRETRGKPKMGSIGEHVEMLHNLILGIGSDPEGL